MAYSLKLRTNIIPESDSFIFFVNTIRSGDISSSIGEHWYLHLAQTPLFSWCQHPEFYNVKTMSKFLSTTVWPIHNEISEKIISLTYGLILISRQVTDESIQFPAQVNDWSIVCWHAMSRWPRAANVNEMNIHVHNYVIFAHTHIMHIVGWRKSRISPQAYILHLVYDTVTGSVQSWV